MKTWAGKPLPIPYEREMTAMKHRFLALALSAVLTLSLLPISAGAAGFRDVPSGSALAGEVAKANAYGLMSGYSATTFGYADPMTRAQFVTVLSRMMNWGGSTAGGSTQGVTDAMELPAGISDTYFAAISAAARAGAVDTDKPFRPNDAITRAEMSEMLVRGLGLGGAAKLLDGKAPPFTDVTSRQGYIAVAYAIGMTKGMTATTFAPDRSATRAQAAAMLVRIYEKLQTAGKGESHGFYAISSYSQIQLAEGMDSVSFGWSRMTWADGNAKLATTSAGVNEFCVPSGYETAVKALEQSGTQRNLMVYMDTSAGLNELLSSEAGRTQAVSEIVNEVTVSYRALGHNPYTGVTIDFEGLRSAQKASFTAFLTALQKELKTAGKSLSVCVSPTLTTGTYYDGYDYRAIGRLADRVILMAYDYQARDLSGYLGTEYHKTAAVAPIDQIFASLLDVTDVRTGVEDVSKVLLGVQFQSIAWKVDGSGKLLSGTPVYPDEETLAKRLGQSGTVTGWSQDYQCPYIRYTDENGDHWFAFYENGDSLHAKCQAAALLGITGVSYWRLGVIPAERLGL